MSRCCSCACIADRTPTTRHASFYGSTSLYFVVFLAQPHHLVHTVKRAPLFLPHASLSHTCITSPLMDIMKARTLSKSFARPSSVSMPPLMSTVQGPTCAMAAATLEPTYVHLVTQLHDHHSDLAYIHVVEDRVNGDGNAAPGHLFPDVVEAQR